MRSTTAGVALDANGLPEPAVSVVLGFVRQFMIQLSASKSLRETCDLFLLVLRFSHLVVSQSREFVANATEEDRARLLELARRLQALVSALDDCEGELKRSRITRSMPIRGRLLLRRLAQLAEEADDVAENAALSASIPFAERVHRELAAVKSGDGIAA